MLIAIDDVLGILNKPELEYLAMVCDVYPRGRPTKKEIVANIAAHCHLSPAELLGYIGQVDLVKICHKLGVAADLLNREQMMATIASMVRTEKPVLIVGAMGGSISLLEISTGGKLQYCVHVDETSLSDFLDDEEDLSLESTTPCLDSFDEALLAMDRYPWPMLYPRYLASEFACRVLDAVEERGGSRERWRRLMQ